MNVIFNIVYPEEIKLPIQNIQALIDSYQVRKKTGIIRLGYAFEKQLCFLFKRGVLLNICLVTPDKSEILPTTQGIEWMLSAGAAYTKEIALSSFGLLMAKLLVQSTSQNTETFTNQTQLYEYLTACEEKAETALIRIGWQAAAGAILFAPRAAARFNFISRDITLDAEGSYKIFSESKESQSVIQICAPDLALSAWQEYYLRSAFAQITENILLRFENLTGRGLMDSLMRLVTVFATRQNLDIAIVAHRLEDHEVFSNPQDAAYNYTLILREMFEHFSAVIGPRLHASTLREIIQTLPEHERNIITAFQLLPQGYLYE